ncbi:MAG: IPT/TIG domain-containing protein [Candidatus Kapabacteria bacterium]|nr:IPT/TIG domain-containing protein [Candidatus Kapabacteria bacterium]
MMHVLVKALHRTYALRLMIIALAFVPLATFAQPGTIDTTFVPDLPPAMVVRAVVVQPDGKILVGGNYGMKRLNADGSTDVSFALRGSYTMRGISPAAPEPNFPVEVYAIALQPDGKILVGGNGSSYGGGQYQPPTSLGLVRLNADGTNDATFNPGGEGVDAFYNQGFELKVKDIIIRPSGKILISGDFTHYNRTPRAGFAQLNNDGTLDLCFSISLTAGLSQPFGGTPLKMLLQPDGKLVLTGVSNFHGAASYGLARLNVDASSDPSFYSGVTVTSYNNYAYGGLFSNLQLLANNKYLGIGPGGLRTIGSDAKNDSSFFVPGSFTGTLLQPDGKIIATAAVGSFGATGVGGGGASAGSGDSVARFNSNGTQDTTFKRSFVPNGVNALALQTDGKLLVGTNSGAAYNAGKYSFWNFIPYFDSVRAFPRNGLVRLNNDTPPAPTPTAAYSGFVFGEGIANNGSVSTTQTITLSNTTWSNSIANGTPLTAGTHYTVANVPAGLTMVLTKTTTAQVQISFTGSASAHAAVNNVNNLQITFLNSAVQNGNAAAVGGLNGQNLSINFNNPPVAPAPTLNCIAIASTGGNTVIITGNNLNGATSVKFGGVNAQNFTVNSATQITATVAFGSTSGSYTVTTPGGTASCAMFTYIPTPPIITSFNPAFGVNPQNVTISGTNFLGTTQVTFGGVPATIVSVTNTKIVATLGVGTVSSTPIIVAVTKPDGTARVNGFVYSNIPPIPNITSFSPACGTTGTVVTINGTGFSGAKSVNFGAAPAAFTIVNDLQILATVTSGASGSVTVTSLSGTHSLPGFTYNPLPTISSFTPNNPDAGQTLTINGTNFTSSCSTVQNLYLGGNLVPPGNITIVSPTQLSVVVPANASSGTVQLIRTDNSNATRTGFLFNAPRPISFTPTSGTTGTAVIITGQNFSGTSGAAGVRINGVNAASYTVDSDTQITAFPAATSALTGTVVVTNSNGNGSLGTFTFTPPPFVDGFYAARGAVGDTVTIFGRNFTGATAVKFGANNATDGQIGTILSVSATQITAIVQLGTATGARRIYVQTPAGNGFSGTGGTRTFLIGAPTAAPTVTGISPNPVSQQDSVLTITGTNLATTSAVLLNGVPLSFSATPNATTVRVRIPNGTMDGVLTLYTHGGTVITPAVSILALPTITSFTPTTGPTGTVVIITGTGFTGVSGAASVRFGATNAASYTVNSNTQITATVAAGSTGLIRVVAPGGTVYSATNFTHITPPSAPTMTNVSTDIGVTGTVVVITGTNFARGVTSVTFGGVAGTIISTSGTQIQVAVGAGNSGNIVVTTPAGSVNSNTALGITFTYLPHPIPTITSFSPASGTEGSSVTLSGTNFTGMSRITIGGALVTAFTVNSDNQITATVPAGAITGKIIVFKDVVSPTNTLIAQSATDYTVIPLLVFAKSGAEVTSGQSLSAITGVENVPTVGMTVFPNPAQSTITVQTTLNTSGIARLSLLNALGVMVWTAEVSVQAGAFERQIELSNLPSGFYVTELRLGAERLTKRFVKQ